MPLLFFIDKDILEDPACRGVEDVVLSYTFFRCVYFLSFVYLYPVNIVKHSALAETHKAYWNLTLQKMSYRIR